MPHIRRTQSGTGATAGVLTILNLCMISGTLYNVRNDDDVFEEGDKKGGQGAGGGREV